MSAGGGPGTWDALSGSWPAVIVSSPMSTADHASPSTARRDAGVLLLTKRRPIDFGLVATCLCRP